MQSFQHKEIQMDIGYVAASLTSEWSEIVGVNLGAEFVEAILSSETNGDVALYFKGGTPPSSIGTGSGTKNRWVAKFARGNSGMTGVVSSYDPVPDGTIIAHPENYGTTMELPNTQIVDKVVYLWNVGEVIEVPGLDT
jgi:hypothetical protein